MNHTHILHHYANSPLTSVIALVCFILTVLLVAFAIWVQHLNEAHLHKLWDEQSAEEEKEYQHYQRERKK